MTAVTEDTATCTGYISHMNETGDIKIKWDKGNPAEVAAARAMFAQLKTDKYRTYRKNGDDRELIHEFDPDARQIVAAPQTVGG